MQVLNYFALEMAAFVVANGRHCKEQRAQGRRDRPGVKGGAWGGLAPPYDVLKPALQWSTQTRLLGLYCQELGYTKTTQTLKYVEINVKIKVAYNVHTIKATGASW